MSRPAHLHPTAPIAPRVLLPGDPGRALLLAQELLTEPKMANHHRGLWGYTGMAADGQPLTIQATGIGGPSAAIVLEELCDLGVTRAVRVGTCGALAGGPALGDLVVATEALSADGTSRALGAGGRVAADARLTAALEGEGVAGLIVSADLYYGRDGLEDAWRDAGAVASDLQTAALLAVGARRGIAVASILVVAGAGGERLEGEDLELPAKAAGHAAARALRENKI